MDVRSELKQFHPCSEMKCLSKGRSDIVVIKRGKGPELSLIHISEPTRPY